MDSLSLKLDKLRQIIQSYRKVLVAFSGGCDSAFVLKVSRDILGKDGAKGAIAKSASLPEAELEEAREVAREVDTELIEIETSELENPSYTKNPINRCYFCKSELYSHLHLIAEKLGFNVILNGTNLDDLGDWRPGLKAAEEHNVKSPLVEADFTKEEIRLASRMLGLSTWSKPQAACLSSRVPFGTEVTEERLSQIEEGEEILKGLGFEMVRLRWFGQRALIEVGRDETKSFFQNSEVREEILNRLKSIGFKQVDLHIEGYRSGRLNPHSP
ncbi:MAG: ATP-dependent sacrificial sulfur transferase LarE [Candidatus Omnitrophica bacterium]|nr:ATP-dependent sacrificial sulfur transferase LarE [Candidatus Omnitrophota bacterium]